MWIFHCRQLNFYAGRVISLGTLMAVFLSTSDEMLPILIAESVSITVILKIIGIKILVGMCIGLILDFMIRKWWPHRDVSFKIEELCEQEHCHCHKNLFNPGTSSYTAYFDIYYTHKFCCGIDYLFYW